MFNLKATALQDVDKVQIVEARSSLAELKKRKGRDAAELAKQCEAAHRQAPLRMAGKGAAAPCAERLVEVQALVDADALKNAEPRWMGGELFDPEAVRPRGGDGPAAGGSVFLDGAGRHG